MYAIERSGPDIVWDSYSAGYRLFVFDGVENDTAFDLFECQMSEVEPSARALTGDEKLWSIALLVDDCNSNRRLVWLSGGDYNKAPADEREWRMRAEMQDRYLRHRARKKRTLTLPDGSRVARLLDCPRFGSAAIALTAPATELSLSRSTGAALRDWNHQYQLRHEFEPAPKEWIDQGYELRARVQEEAGATVEVRPDFDTWVQ
ncbi:hypothetical protein [uncultured Microbacterium sp.]|uniref:hypothetical protein n=1 Tax=uncultured Microbacterium sp. TaxID=191216 RepID=UPI0028E26187|nr:hypothetical protein [uncultured Microbacterium sp.]